MEEGVDNNSYLVGEGKCFEEKDGGVAAKGRFVRV